MIPRKIGLIAFTDILGYSSLIEYNDVGEQLFKTLELLSQLPDEVILIMAKYSTEAVKNHRGIPLGEIPFEFESHINNINSLIISDSILTYLEIDTSNPLSYNLALNAYFWYMMHLYEKFMKNGLPIRGAISGGEFITVNNSFAGKPIIEAYKAGNNLNCAGIFVDINAINKMLDIDINDFYETRNLIKEIDFINRKKESQRAYFLKITSPKDPFFSEEYRSEEEWIVLLTSYFTAHNKRMSKGAMEKIKGTIDMIKKLKQE